MKAAVLFSIVCALAISNCEDTPDICMLTQDGSTTFSMYCSCDSELLNKANSITCYIFGKLVPTDTIWKGFERQQKILSLTFNSRPENRLSFVPIDVLRMTTNLKSLTLAVADLGHLNPYTFSRMNDLETISISSNNITGISSHTFAYLPSLSKLTLSENEISKLPENSFYELPELRRLYLDQNNLSIIEDLAFLHLPHLQELDLFQNQLHHVSPKTFVGLKSLHRLDLSRNKLTRIEDDVFMAMPQLRELDLSVNSISDVSTGAFQGLSHLRSLKLNLNRITSLPGGLFTGAPNLMAVDLASNRLSTLNENVLDGLTHSKNQQFSFQLKKNPLECSCDLLWLAKFALEHETSLFVYTRHLKCEVNDFIVRNWTRGEHIPITALATIEEAECPKTTTTTSTTTMATTTTTTEEPSSKKPNKKASGFEKKTAGKMAAQEMELSDAIAEEVTKSIEVAKPEKHSRQDSKGSAATFKSNMFASVVYFILVLVAERVRMC